MSDVVDGAFRGYSTDVAVIQVDGRQAPTLEATIARLGNGISRTYRHPLSNATSNELKRLTRPSLLVVDEIGYLPVSSITSKSFEKWGEIFIRATTGTRPPPRLPHGEPLRKKELTT